MSEEVLKVLIKGMKKHSSIDAKFRNELIEFIKKNGDSLAIISKKFKFDINFYQLFVKDKLQDKSGSAIDEDRYYKNFKRLKKFSLIHKSSAYSFLKSLSLVSINPNHTSLLSSEFSQLDLFIKERKKIIEKIQHNDKYLLYYLYIYLRCFAIKPLSKRELQSMRIENLIYLRHDIVVQCFEGNKILGRDSLYKLYIYDEDLASALRILGYTQRDFFKNVELYEKQFLKFKKEKLLDIKIMQLKYINRNLNIFNYGPLYTSIYSGLVQSVPLTLSELDKFFPNRIQKSLMKKEQSLLDSALRKNFTAKDEEDVIPIKSLPEDMISGVSISEIDELANFLISKNNSPTDSEILGVINDVELYLKIDSSIHANIFFEYVIYLLEYIRKKKLRASTVRGYIYILSKHILKPIEDLNQIQEHELQYILNRLNSDSYKPNSKKHILRLINRFFKFCGEKNLQIDVQITSYPKSMVFFDEFIEVLNKIKNQYKDIKLGRHNRLEMLQRQVVVIFGFYSGMRKNELRTRELSDLYIYNDDKTVYIDVNNNGLRKEKMKLKTAASKRRIKMELDLISIEIVSEWKILREELNKRSKYIFLSRSEGGGFLNKVMQEKEFIGLNHIIQNVTNRYCTFHSLRHSFTTYRLKKLLSNTNRTPYSLIELSVELGHVTPNITLESYSHANLLLVDVL